MKNTDSLPIEISKLREKINDIDLQLLQLIVKRAKLSFQVAEHKQSLNIPNYDPIREKQIIDSIVASYDEEHRIEAASLKKKVSEKEGDPVKQIIHIAKKIDGQVLRAIFREIISGCRETGKATRLGCLGPIGSFSHCAAQVLFGSGIKPTFFSTIEKVFLAVQEKKERLAIVPIENSTEGNSDRIDR